MVDAVRLWAASPPRDDDITAAEFSLIAWPDSPGHGRRINGPWGLGPPAGISRAAGSFLSRLRKAGLVRQIDHVTFSTWRLKAAALDPAKEV
jgi:hypothetical protein